MAIAVPAVMDKMSLCEFSLSSAGTHIWRSKGRASAAKRCRDRVIRGIWPGSSYTAVECLEHGFLTWLGRLVLPILDRFTAGLPGDVKGRFCYKSPAQVPPVQLPYGPIGVEEFYFIFYFLFLLLPLHLSISLSLRFLCCSHFPHRPDRLQIYHSFWPENDTHINKPFSLD